jgi:hypothetical protein
VKVGKYSTVLSLDELTGHHGSAEKNMEIEDGQNIIALTTDNPTVMQAFRLKFQNIYYWVLVRYL